MTIYTHNARVKGLHEMSDGALIEEHAAISVQLTDAIDRSLEEEQATHDMAALLRKIGDELRRRGYRYYNNQGWHRK
jgi:hypothetical protein